MGFGLLCVAENRFTAEDEGGWWVWVLFVWGYWMSVVGFDIGNENCVITVAKQGGFVIHQTIQHLDQTIQHLG